MYYARIKRPNDVPSNSLKDSNVNLKVKTTKEGVRGTFLSSQHLRGKKGVLELKDGDYDK
jgi:hypothetical protein